MPAIVMVVATTTAPAEIAASSTEADASADPDPEPPKKKKNLATLCNCYAYLASLIGELPHMADIVPNTTPHVGAVAVFYYHDKHTGALVKHVALIDKISATGFTVAESNFTHCVFDRRVIAWDDPHVAGFWSS